MSAEPQPDTDRTLDITLQPPSEPLEKPVDAVSPTLASESLANAAPRANPVPEVPQTRLGLSDDGGSELTAQPPLAYNGLSVPGYEIIGELGRGGMGVVYKARQTKANRLVALKMILASRHAGTQERMRFRIEAEAVARLQHPNIVQLHDVGELDGRPFFSLEFCEGGSLDKRMKQDHLSAERAAALIETLARAMHYAHSRGVVHRDLKPANILLDGEGTPKIADFGLAKRLDSEFGQTQTGEIMGTPDYMAPEQASGRIKEIGPGTDIYALGAILYDMLTGRPPFQAPSVLEALELVRSQEPVPPSRLRVKLARDLETICLKCLQKEPHKRYASALELAEDLKSYLNGEPIRARPVSIFERGLRWSRRNPIVAGLLVALTFFFLAGILFSVLVWRQSAQQYDEMAVQGAALQATTLENLREQYTADVVTRAKMHAVPVTHNYRKQDGAIPLPATLVKELGQRINKDRPGADVRLYSDYPFPWRKGTGSLDLFEQDALAELRKNPEEPYFRFGEIDGIPVLRYAVADRMRPACIECHNNHPDSPKKDWKEGDVRGVLEIIRPLDQQVAETRARLRWLFVIPISIAGLAVAAGLVFLYTRRLRRR